MKKRTLLLLTGLLVMFAIPAWSQSRTDDGFRLDWRNAPPAPRIYFNRAPQIRWEPQSRVYVVTNVDRYGVDMFRTGNHWFMTRDGFWYRATTYRGPWRAVNPRAVPARIYDVPMRAWNYHPNGERYAYDDRDRWDGRTYMGYHIDVANAPPAPRIYFRGQPDMLYIPETGAYVVDNMDFDVDMFRFGDYWYVTDNGYWYRAVSYRGPFVAIDARSVPEAVYDTPDRNWRHRPMRDDRRWGDYRQGRSG